MRPEDVDRARGLSGIRDELRARNYEVASLDLNLSRKVPDDAALIIVAGPQGRLQPFEEELFRNYLSTRAGRLILLLGSPRSGTTWLVPAMCCPRSARPGSPAACGWTTSPA